MNLQKINLLNLKSRLDSFGFIPDDQTVMVWSAANARFEPVQLKTAGGLSLIGAGNLVSGGASSFYVVDLAEPTTNVTTDGVQTIDGVLTSGKVVLVGGQTDQKDNGVYMTNTTGPWSRILTAAEVKGRVFYVNEGSVSHHAFFRNTNTSLTYGVDPVTFEQLFFQEKLISGTNIKTVNGNTLLGSGNLSVVSAASAFGNIITMTLNEGNTFGTVMWLLDPSMMIACKNNVGGSWVKLGILVQDGLAGESRQIATFGSIVNTGAFLPPLVPGTLYYVQGDNSLSTVANGDPFGKAISASKMFIMEPV